jgi:hypothetical protein
MFSINGRVGQQQSYIGAGGFGQNPTPRNKNISEGNQMDPAGLSSSDAPFSVVRSTVSTKTQLRGKYRYILRPYPYGSTKPNINVPRLLEADISSSTTLKPTCGGFANDTTTASLFSRMLALRSGSTMKTPLP